MPPILFHDRHTCYSCSFYNGLHFPGANTPSTCSANIFTFYYTRCITAAHCPNNSRGKLLQSYILTPSQTYEGRIKSAGLFSIRERRYPIFLIPKISQNYISINTRRHCCALIKLIWPFFVFVRILPTMYKLCCIIYLWFTPSAVQLQHHDCEYWVSRYTCRSHREDPFRCMERRVAMFKVWILDWYSFVGVWDRNEERALFDMRHAILDDESLMCATRRVGGFYGVKNGREGGKERYASAARWLREYRDQGASALWKCSTPEA